MTRNTDVVDSFQPFNARSESIVRYSKEERNRTRSGESCEFVGDVSDVADLRSVTELTAGVGGGDVALSGESFGVDEPTPASVEAWVGVVTAPSCKAVGVAKSAEAFRLTSIL